MVEDENPIDKRMEQGMRTAGGEGTQLKVHQKQDQQIDGKGMTGKGSESHLVVELLVEAAFLRLPVSALGVRRAATAAGRRRRDGGDGGRRRRRRQALRRRAFDVLRRFARHLLRLGNAVAWMRTRTHSHGSAHGSATGGLELVSQNYFVYQLCRL